MWGILFVINLILAFTIIFLERKEPSATLAWLLVLFLIPGVGIVLYAAFSQNISRQKIFTIYENEEMVVSSALRKQHQALDRGTFPFVNSCGEKWRELIRLNQVYGESYYTQDNEVEIITDGEDKMRRLFADIENAEKSINIQYFIIKKDIAGDALLKRLIARARQGVEVRLLVDALGSRTINRELVRELKAAGGLYGEFFPTKWKFFNTKINYRNHRKIVVIDNSVGYTGGFNIAREYVGLKKKFGYWRDTHLRITGGSVKDLNMVFMLDWRAATGEMLDIEEMLFEPYPVQGSKGIQIVSCGPDRQREQIKRAFLKMITTAKKSIYIQTPYFVPDRTILECLKMAAQSGVDVNLMIPCIPDHMFVYWATYSYVAEIMRAGGNIYIYDEGFLHAKTMVVDGEVSTAGSCNFDIRSFKLNFETNAFVYDRDVSIRLEEAFREDMRRSHLLTPEIYEERGIIIRIKEVFSRILSDIL